MAEADNDKQSPIGGLRFHVAYKGEPQQTVELAQDCIFIGRLLTSHLPVEDPKVSRMHAFVEVRGGTDVFVNDLQSSNGTLLNGSPQVQAEVENGDVIQVGDTTIKVEILSQDAVAENPSVVYRSGLSRGVGQQARVDTVLHEQGDFGDVEIDADDIDGALAQFDSPSKIGKARSLPDVSTAPDIETTIAPKAKKKAAPKKKKAAAKKKAPAKQKAAKPAAVRPPSQIKPIKRALPRGVFTSLELKVQWGDEILDILHLTEPVTISIGTGRTNTYIIPSMSDYPTLPLIQPIDKKHGEGYILGFTDNMEGWVYTGERLNSLEDLKNSPRTESRSTWKGKLHLYPLSPNDKGIVSVENLAFCFQTVRSFPPYVSPPDKVNRKPYYISGMLWMMLAVFLHLFPVPENEPSIEDQVKETARAIKVLYSPQQAKSLLDNLVAKNLMEIGDERGDIKGRANVGKPKKGKRPTDRKAGGKEGKMKTVKRKVRTQKNPRKVERTGKGLAKALDALKSSDINKLLGKSGFSGRGGGAGALNKAGKHGGAPRVFATIGSSLRGGSGGGSLGGVKSIDVGGLGTKGRGGGAGGYGTVKLGRKYEVLVDYSEEGGGVLRGQLDRELVERIINRNKGQIKYCYDSVLQYAKTTKGLSRGRIVMQWTIAASGRVLRATVVESTVNNATFDQCVRERIKSWVFPAPKGGGVVVVKYPFILRQGG